jgi:hypothetical protein
MAHKSSGCVPWVLEKKFGSNFGHGKNLATWSSDLRDVCDGGSLSSTVNFTHFLAQQQRHW